MNIRYNCAVTEVNYADTTNDEYTRIKCANGKIFLTRYTVVTASIQILKDKDIAFTPEIDPKWYSHRKFWQGIKIVFQYPTKFYPIWTVPFPSEFDGSGENLFWDGAISAPSGKNNKNILMGYLLGDYATNHNFCCTDDEMKNQIESILKKRSFPGKTMNAENYYIAWNGVKNNLPYVKGALSADTKKPNFGAPIVNPGKLKTVLLAGEAYPTVDDEYGTY